MNTNPFVAGCRAVYELASAELRASVAGLDSDGLNWRPDSPDTSTIAILTHHALGSTRDWICIALGLERPKRSRAEEFETAFASEATALELVDTLIADTLRVFDDAPADVAWTEVVQTVPLPGDPETTRAYCLVHAIEHLREHVAQLMLTRQLGDARVT